MTGPDGKHPRTSTVPIGDLALLSDRHSAALVDRAGSVVWLCLPRFDSPSVFGALLDDDAGHWSLRPADGTPVERVERRYEPGTLVLTTVFHTPDGVLEVRDALDAGAGDDPHRLGADAPHAVLRTATCTRGEVEVAADFRPRPEYGLVEPLLTPVEGGCTASGGPDRLTLSSTVDLELDGGRASARFRLAADGDRVPARAAQSLEWSPLHAPFPAVRTEEQVADGLEATARLWRDWSEQHQAYTGPWRDLVHLSGRVLHALSHQPTGAVIAAATTSLPEEVGGSRNWDYRYAWVRDASMTLNALWVAACPDEAHEYFDFVAAAGAGTISGRTVPVMLGVGGERDLTERTLDHLAGWRDSRPVRVGNGAWDQTQLDVYGEVLDAALRLREQLDGADRRTRDFLVTLADTAADRWTEPDHGIWEIRGDPQHFLHSKVMCWVALDRAASMADWLGAEDRADRWREVADEIHAEVLDQGWDDDVGSFTQFYGSDRLDAAALRLPIVGFLPGDDERVRATIERVEERLSDDRGLLRRYDTGEGNVDGLSGDEGTFLLCTFWLAEALARAGEVDRAVTVFERAVGYAGDVGLLAEEVDTATGELLGNMPQAFSHIGLVNAAWAIQQAQEGTPGG